MISYIKHNFYLVIENWAAQIRAHRAHRRTIKVIHRHRRELKYRIREANELHRATKKAYYVLPNPDNVLMVLDKANVKTLKKFKVMDKAVTCVDLLTESEYNTMNNHFVVLIERDGHGNTLKEWEFFRGTVLECVDKYKNYFGAKIQILGNFERVVTIKNGKVTKH